MKGRWRLALGLALGLAGAVAPALAVAQPPTLEQDPLPPLDRPLPPVDPLPGADDPEPVLTEEELRAQRMARFEEHLTLGQTAARELRHDDAIREFTEALKLVPGDPDALLGRAESRYARTPPDRCPRRAIADLLMLGTYDPRGRWLPQRPVALSWMARCGADHRDDRLGLAREMAEEAPGTLGRPAHIRYDLARLLHDDVDNARSGAARDELRAQVLHELETYREEIAESGEDPRPDAVRLLGDLYRAAARLEDAIAAYRTWGETQSGEGKKTAQKLVAALEDEVTLREWERIYGGKPTAEAETEYRAGLDAYKKKDLASAEQHFTASIEASRWFPKSWYMRGLVHADNGKFAQAVEDLEYATTLDRSYYDAHMTLGLIYQREFAGTRDDNAREHLEIALGLRPDLHHLHLLLGELYARRDREVARSHYRRFLEKVPLSDPDAQRARKALDELDRTIREDTPLLVSPPPEESLRFLDPALQRLINEAYLKVQQQNWDRAETILREAMERFPGEPVVVNELAKVMYAQKRFGDARTHWEKSLEMDPDQLEVHEHLGLLLIDDLPNAAMPHLRFAADGGLISTRYTLAKLLWDQREPLEAYEQLQRYLAQAPKYDLHFERAKRLEREIQTTILYGGLAASVLLVLLIGFPSYRLYRRYRGSSLAQLLERHPKSFPEVARVLSLIRHEILKHNTAFLADVGRALEMDDPEAEARSQMLARRMFGETGPSDGGRAVRGGSRERTRAAEEGGIYGRFLGYVEELHQVARSYGLRLNLYRKDAIFRPMLKAFEELAENEKRLRNPHQLRGSRRLELARRLNRLGRVLGRQAFEHLSSVIRELCVVTVDDGLVQGVFKQVCGEEQFAGLACAPLQVRGEGAQVRIFRTDLEDILGNVMRNSLRSSMQYAAPPVTLGVDLRSELDEITGLASLAIRIKDRSPEKLSNEMLRGRYVERGMGITVDLLSRYDGAIGVEPENGWEKAVVLRFFTLEESTGHTQEARLAS